MCHFYRTQLEHHMKYRPLVTPASLKSGEGGEPAEGRNQEQKEEAAEQLTQPQMIQTIVSQVLHLLKAPSADTQKGFGSDGLIENVPDSLPIQEASPNTIANETLLKGSESDQTESTSDKYETTSDESNNTDQKLLETVSPFRQAKAKKFLSALKEHADNFSYSSEGTIFIDGRPLENSDFFKLFPYLFKPAHFANHPNLREVVNELATLGLGHYLSRFYTAGLSPRGKNFIHDRHTVHKQIKALGSDWYKLGND